MKVREKSIISLYSENTQEFFMLVQCILCYYVIRSQYYGFSPHYVRSLQLAMLDFCQEGSRGGGRIRVTRLAVYCNYLKKKKKKKSYVKIFIQVKYQKISSKTFLGTQLMTQKEKIIFKKKVSLKNTLRPNSYLFLPIQRLNSVFLHTRCNKKSIKRDK